MAFAFVFPGQGSQSLGMLASLEREPAVRSTFQEASAVLGYDLWRLTQAGPEMELNATENTQPAMLTAGVALWRTWRARGGPLPSVVAGHSLGEFTALVCAGALDFSAAVGVVRLRGRAMQEAVPPGSGAMAAVIGLDEAQVRQACAVAAEGAVVEPVNFNAPGQIVIAGERAAVERAIEAARKAGAKRAVALTVSVPAHSRLMQPAAERLAVELARVTLHAPRVPFVSAVDATEHGEPAELRALLVRQLAAPVRWHDTVRALAGRGARAIIECGPGKVLTGLNRRIARGADLVCLALEDSAAIEAALAAVRNPETVHAGE
ncbi:MAG TPA: ACP S-malonyltransferase [Steroidobacteraceae bacterium]|nr:ACP S-malonyltransferase [Steroidobacteraceae bacterium]